MFPVSIKYALLVVNLTFLQKLLMYSYLVLLSIDRIKFIVRKKILKLLFIYSHDRSSYFPAAE